MVALAIVRISAGRGRRPHLRGRLGRVDNFVLLSFEAMARNFVGIHFRTMSMWSGGIYFMALLVSADRSRKQAAQLRAQALWPRILRFEALLQADHVPQEVRDFDAHFLWSSSPVYRELLALVAHGHLAAAQQLAWLIFAGIYHEKGDHMNSLVGIPIKWFESVKLYIKSFESASN